MSAFVNRLTAQLRGDRSIWAVAAMLALFSVLGVYSSTGSLAYLRQEGDTEAYLIRHVIILLGGFFLAYVIHLMNHTMFSRSAPYMLMIAVPMLLYTLVFGVNINDARRWIELPLIGVTFQTSDFAKLALILYVARAISAKQEQIKDLHGAFLPIIIPVVIVCVLIAPADLSTAILLFVSCVGMMFVGRVAVKYIGALILAGLLAFIILVAIGNLMPEYIRVDTWISRMQDYRDNPMGGYQIRQAKIAIANGEWFGSGPGNSIQRNFLPSPYSDFIYAIICEEYGVIGGFFLIVLYLVLFFRVTRLVTKSPKAFGAMVAVGLAISMTLQAYINIAVATHLVPVTGVTLPMVSMGGTSTMFTCIAFGIILSVSRFVESISQ